MKQLFRIVFILLAFLTIYSHFKRKDLSDVSLSSLREELATEPIQTESSEEPFRFSYMEREYYVKPLAEYELWGLVVTHNDIHAFDDIYHDDDSVDIKDLCVIWGSNVSNAAFQNIEFWSEPWTCNVRWQHGEGDGFSIRDFSNNHMLSDSPWVRKTINRMQIGDQIYIRGKLVSYSEPSKFTYARTSSLTRDDEGNGACEVLFAEHARILKTGPSFWRNTHRYAKKLLIVLFLFSVGNFFYQAYKPMFKK